MRAGSSATGGSTAGAAAEAASSRECFMMRGPGPQSEHAGLKSEHAAASEVGVHSGMAHSGTATLASITSSVATAIHVTLSADLAIASPTCVMITVL